MLLTNDAGVVAYSGVAAGKRHHHKSLTWTNT
jgi:hypothetical protein